MIVSDQWLVVLTLHPPECVSSGLSIPRSRLRGILYPSSTDRFAPASSPWHPQRFLWTKPIPLGVFRSPFWHRLAAPRCSANPCWFAPVFYPIVRDHFQPAVAYFRGPSRRPRQPAFP